MIQAKHEWVPPVPWRIDIRAASKCTPQVTPFVKLHRAHAGQDAAQKSRRTSKFLLCVIPPKTYGHKDNAQIAPEKAMIVGQLRFFTQLFFSSFSQL